MRRPLAVALAIFALVATAPERVAAQSENDSTEATKQTAKEHFERGNELLAEGDNQAALAEFLRSRELYPTRGNTLNAAVVLRKLGRYDESLAMFERLLAEFPEADPAELADVKREIEVLETRIGALDIRTEPGATVYVDNRERGTTPLSAPLSVSAGSRVVRVIKAGRLPFERRIEIAGRQRMTLEVELRPATEAHEPSAGVAAPEPVAPKPAVIPVETRVRPFVALDASGLISPSLGGELRARCEDPCSASLPLGVGAFLSAGVALSSGIDIGAELGVLRLGARYEDRADPIAPVGWSGEGRASDDLTLTAIAVGGTVAIRSGRRAPLSFGLGIGVLAASMRAERSGSYAVERGDPPEQRTIDVSANQSARGWYAYVGPEVRVAFPLSDAFELSVGLELLLLLALSPPEWDRNSAVVSEVGFTQFEADTLTGSVLVVAMPGVGARYAF